MKIKNLSLFVIFISLTFISCKKEKDALTTGAIELSGIQETAITLTNRFNSLTTADYVVSGSYTIQASVVIEPGTVIVMKPGAQITIEGSGSLKAVGTTDLPIIFTGESKTSGSWNKILFRSNNSNNQLIHTIIEYGGGDASYNASVYGYLNGRVSIANSTIRYGQNYGVLIYSPEFILAQFENNTIHNIQLAPVLVRPTHIDKFNESFVAYDNGRNRIEVDNGAISTSLVLSKTLIPYFLKSGNIEVNSDFELLSGVNFIMGPGAGFSVTSSGSFKAIGTQLSPITITGEQSLNGYWNYIRFNGSNNLNNELQFCTVSYGGGDNSWNAIMYLYDNSRLRLGNSTIMGSQNYGVINYSNANTFVDDGNNEYLNNNMGDIGN